MLQLRLNKTGLWGFPSVIPVSPTKRYLLELYLSPYPVGWADGRASGKGANVFGVMQITQKR